MRIELTTISTKRFLLITLVSIPLIMFLSLGLAILSSTQALVLLLIPLFGLSIYLGQRLSRIETRIDLEESDILRIDEQEILYSSVIGYFINETGFTQRALCLRLDTKETIQITGSASGERGKKFLKAQDVILKQLKKKNPDLLELEYQDVYVRQTNILRPVLYVLAGIVVIIDIVAFYLLVTGQMDLPWQIFLVNLLFIGLIPYMKKRKPTNANKT